MATALDQARLDELKSIVGPNGWTEDPDVLEPQLTEWRGLYHGATPMMLMPATAAEAAAILRSCNAARIGVVPQGGNTGLVGGAIPGLRGGAAEVLLSASRLKQIRELDADNYTITAEAGCVLATLQDAAAEAERLFPLSLAAEGSCQLGGNISTNAGGTNVLRYGNMRELVLGLEVVLPDGRIYDGLRGLRKDNTGYDLKQLFIGAEGTLGFITAATCKLYPRPRSTATALLAIGDPNTAVLFYSHARIALGDELTACELIPRIAIDLVVEHIDGCRDPLNAPGAWYLLIELAGAVDQEVTDARLEAFLADALEGGEVDDGVVASSAAQRDELWRMRHSISEAQRLAGAGIKHDVSVPVSQVAEFITRATECAEREVPGVIVVPFGHLGDGNIHFNLNQPDGMSAEHFLELWQPLNRAIHSIAAELGGSFSAEHGIGVLKTSELVRLRSDVELDLMRAVKQALDPNGIMNPGKVLQTPA